MNKKLYSEIKDYLNLNLDGFKDMENKAIDHLILNIDESDIINYIEPKYLLKIKEIIKKYKTNSEENDYDEEIIPTKFLKFPIRFKSNDEDELTEMTERLGLRRSNDSSSTDKGELVSQNFDDNRPYGSELLMVNSDGIVDDFSEDVKSLSFESEELIKNKKESANHNQEEEMLENETVYVTNNIEENMDGILKVIRENKITILRGNTGCGKSTKIPIALLKEYQSIICTQPRRISAIGLANWVSKLKETKLGEDVGFKVRFNYKYNIKIKTKLLYVTDGLFLKELTNNYKNIFNKYDLIIIDEAHERSIHMDILLGFLKDKIQDSKCKLLIMSATLDSKKLVKYFNCPLVTLKHKHHTVKIEYLEIPTNNLFDDTIDKVFDIIKKYKNGNILVFMAGSDEIKKAVYQCNEYLEGTGIKVLPLYSTLPMKDQELVFENYKRKVIFSTNIAETSITIDNIQFVIDLGYVKIKEIDPNTFISSLNTISISKCQAKQRMGRAGRTCDGTIFRMYTKEDYNYFNENSKPEILRSDLTDTVLALMSLGINDLSKFSWIDRPSIDGINKSLDYLYTVGAITDTGKPTPLGFKISIIPMPFQFGLSLLHAKKIKCLNKIAVIAAFNESLPIFKDVVPSSFDAQRKKVALKKFDRSCGDFLFYLSIWYQWTNTGFSKRFLENNYLKINTLYKIKDIYDQILNLSEFRNYVSDKSDNIELALTVGFYFNFAKKVTSRSYLTLYNNLKCYIFYRDKLSDKNPKYLIYNNIFSKETNYFISAIEVKREDYINAGKALANYKKYDSNESENGKVKKINKKVKENEKVKESESQKGKENEKVKKVKENEKVKKGKENEKVKKVNKKVKESESQKVKESEKVKKIKENEKVKEKSNYENEKDKKINEMVKKIKEKSNYENEKDKKIKEKEKSNYENEKEKKIKEKEINENEKEKKIKKKDKKIKKMDKMIKEDDYDKSKKINEI